MTLVWLILVNDLCTLEKKIFSLTVGWNVLLILLVNCVILIFYIRAEFLPRNSLLLTEDTGQFFQLKKYINKDACK